MAGFKSFLSRKKSRGSSTRSVDNDGSIGNSNAALFPGGGISRRHSGSDSVRSNAQIEELEHVFKKFDVNGDGKISASELGSIMTSLGQEVPEEELKIMIEEVDADGDGFINLEEFIELNTKGVDHDEILQDLKEAFSVYDIDGNGSITAEELQEVLKSLGDNCSIAECRRMISGVDADGDGTINFEEFRVMMTVGSRFNSLVKK